MRPQGSTKRRKRNEEERKKADRKESVHLNLNSTAGLIARYRILIDRILIDRTLIDMKRCNGH